MDNHLRTNRKGRREYARQVPGDSLSPGELAERMRENTRYNNRHAKTVRKVWNGSVR